MELEASEIPLSLKQAVNAALTLQILQNDSLLNEVTTRIAGLISQRVRVSGSIKTVVSPERSAPPQWDLLRKVAELLREHPLCCALCGGLMPLVPDNKLLQPSPDRIESRSGSSTSARTTCLALNMN